MGELQDLRRESDEWYRANRSKGYYLHECSGWTEQHNREIRIQQLESYFHPAPSDDQGIDSLTAADLNIF